MIYYVVSDGGTTWKLSPNDLTIESVDTAADWVVFFDTSDGGNLKKALASSFGGGGGGETNTASNVGTGEGVFKQKSGVDLEFKTLKSSDSSITISGGTDDIDLTTSGSGADVKVAVDSAATADYIGAASSDGVLRTSDPLTYTDGGDYVTLGVDQSKLTAIPHSATTGQGTDDHHAQSHTIASHSDTTATGAELNELTDSSETSLHSHDVSDLTSRTEWAQNGFENRTDSTLSWDDATHTLTITTSGSYNYWVEGVKYTKSANDSVTIDDSKNGFHAIYYDGATLTAVANPSHYQVITAILHKALVSFVIWDTTTSKAIYVGEERHGKGMSPNIHAYLHFYNGLVLWDGLGLTGMQVDGSTSSNASAQFGIDSGNVADEDISYSIDAVASTVGLPIYYMEGVGLNTWKKQVNAGYSVINSGSATDRLVYNKYDSGTDTWSLEEVSERDFVLCHVFATTEKDNPMIAIVGQNIYTSKRTARAGAETEILTLKTDDVLFPEIREIATVIFQTDKDWGNAVHAKAVSTDDGDDYIDWRNKAVSRMVLTTDDHENLAGLLGGASNDHYHTTEEQHSNLTGIKDYTTVTATTISDADAQAYSKFTFSDTTSGSGAVDQTSLGVTTDTLKEIVMVGASDDTYPNLTASTTGVTLLGPDIPLKAGAIVKFCWSESTSTWVRTFSYVP